MKLLAAVLLTSALIVRAIVRAARRIRFDATVAREHPDLAGIVRPAPRGSLARVVRFATTRCKPGVFE